VTTSPYLDPLDAAKDLLDYIAGRDSTSANVITLAERLDAFMYALRLLLADSVSMVPSGDLDREGDSYDTWRNLIGPRFEMLGYYRITSSSRIKANEKPEIYTADAIDDLSDIAKELAGVEAHLKAFGRDDGLAALRQAYEIHLNMHIAPLRAHLEEVIFDL
jgi:hypothetical protein